MGSQLEHHPMWSGRPESYVGMKAYVQAHLDVSPIMITMIFQDILTISNYHKNMIIIDIPWYPLLKECYIDPFIDLFCSGRCFGPSFGQGFPRICPFQVQGRRREVLQPRGPELWKPKRRSEARVRKRRIQEVDFNSCFFFWTLSGVQRVLIRCFVFVSS